MDALRAVAAKWKVWLPVLVTALAAVGVVVSVSDDNGDNRPDRIVIVIGKAQEAKPALHAPDGQSAPAREIGDPDQPVAKTITVDQDQRLGPEQLKKESTENPASIGPAIHEDMKDEAPGGRQLSNPQDVPTKGVGDPQPLGGAQAYSCPNRYVVNHSKRVGTVRGFALHYTVSQPFTSFNAIWGLFNTRSFAASSDYLFQPGTQDTYKCARLVPPGQKAWTQGNLNNSFESVEITAMGTESRDWWVKNAIKPGILAHLVADRLKASGLKPRFMDPAGCGVQISGWTDHAHLECGNTHHDVRPTFPYKLFAEQVRKDYYAGLCGKKCKRAKTLRRRYADITAKRAKERCRRPGKARRPVCIHLNKRLVYVTGAARREHIKLS